MRLPAIIYREAGMSINRIFRRIIQIIIVLFGISFLTFGLTYLAPGDPVSAMFEAAGISPSEEQIEAVRKSMGLDKPFLAQYFTWLGNCLQGDLGESYIMGHSVASLLGGRIIPTLELSLMSFGVMIVLAVPLGIISAVYQGKWIDNIIRFLDFLGISMPGFWLGLLLQYFIALKLKLLPVAASGTGLERMILPCATLAVAITSKYTRQVRAAVIEELNTDYVIGARARGISWTRILLTHVLPNAMLPLITLLGISFGSLLGGTAVVELIFSYPGLGQLAVKAVGSRDYPLIQGFVLWVALIYMIMNLIVDISYSLIDPRVRESR